MRILFAIAALAVAVSPAVAADNPAQPAQQKPDPSQKVICKTDREVGSMLSTRECHTRAEWERLANSPTDGDDGDDGSASNTRRRPKGG